MITAIANYQRYQGKQKREATRSGQRLDIQGLRMIAVLTVFANHLFGWPDGGFIGVDVFFVISGFLITGNLLRDAERRGTVSFRQFYLNRARRIMPAATVVLLLTFIAALFVFLPFRSQQVGIDALFAFFFLANWHFAFSETDYFQEGAAVSPIQHYWSLSIEEQFYFVWPLLIFLIGAIVIRKGWTHSRRMQLASITMALIVSSSLGWAIYQTNVAPVWAYFDTFSRVWELGVGALLATVVGVLARIPAPAKPILSWGGLALIATSLFLINDHSVGFPAPWALLPVIGAALVIAAGVNGEPSHQEFLRNPVSTYIGNISYSLYLVHWPVIVILASLMERNYYYFLVVVALTFGLSIASYHLIENPLRRANWDALRGGIHDIRVRRLDPFENSKYAILASSTLIVVALTTFALQPIKTNEVVPVQALATPGDPASNPMNVGLPAPSIGPIGAALQDEITMALQATTWPPLDPPLEAVISDPSVNPELSPCGNPAIPNPEVCTLGSASAPTRIVLVGDSIAMTWVGPLRTIAQLSNGQIQLNIQAMDGCQFVEIQMSNDDPSKTQACPGRKQHAIDIINQTKPTVVIVANQYGRKIVDRSNARMTPLEWQTSMRNIVTKFRGSTDKVVFLSPPPADVEISECYGTRSSSPADCISYVPNEWNDIARMEYDLAQELGGTWIDSRPFFCKELQCPAFVGSTPTKRDSKHMTNAYGEKITPAVQEAMTTQGVLPGRS